MDPLPLTPSASNGPTAETGGLIRELFQDAFQGETVTWRMSTNLSKSCRKHPLLQEAALQIQNEIISYQETVNEIHSVEMQMLQNQVHCMHRAEKIKSKQRTAELIRLKRQPVCLDLHHYATEKYSLLQTDDLLPARHECITDFRLSDAQRKRMKGRLEESTDTLFREPILPLKQPLRMFGLLNKPWSPRKTKSKDKLSRTAVNSLHKKSIVKLEFCKTALAAEPNAVIFRNFKIGKQYKKHIIVKNVSASLARYRIEGRPKHSRFAILHDSAQGETFSIAPGMHIKLTILFRCDFAEEPNEYLIIHVRSGKPLIINMHGFRDPPILREAVSALYQSCLRSQALNLGEENCVSSRTVLEGEEECEIHEEELTSTAGKTEELKEGQFVLCDTKLGGNFECEKCFVGEQIIIPKTFKNFGGEGRFFILSEIDWCSMLIDDIMNCNMILLQSFAMWPAYFHLQHDEAIELQTYFAPDSYGVQVEKLYIVCDNCVVQPIELIGDGVLFEPDLIRFGEHLIKISSPDNDGDELAKYYMDMGVTVPNGILKNAILVSNMSGLEIYYRWEKRSMQMAGESQGEWCEDFPMDSLIIQPESGVLTANSITSFRAVAQVKDLPTGTYHLILQFILEDIPLAAIPKKYQAIEECRVKRRKASVVCFCWNTRIIMQAFLQTVDVWIADIEIRVQCFPIELRLPPDFVQDTEEETSSYEEETLEIDKMSVSSHSVKNSQIDSNVSTSANYELEEERQQSVDHDEFTSKHVRNNSDKHVVSSQALIQCPIIRAILRPERPLYIGVEQSFNLILCNLADKSITYKWGQPMGEDVTKMQVFFSPETGEIPAEATEVVEISCRPKDAGVLGSFYVPCFVGHLGDLVMLGIECILDALHVTFHFPPATNMILPPCVDSVRVEWHVDSAAEDDTQQSQMEEERELMNVNLDPGKVVAEASIGTETIETVTENAETEKEAASVVSIIKQEEKKASSNKGDRKRVKGVESEPEEEKEESMEPRSWEDLLRGIVWTENQPNEFIPPLTHQAVIPFYKTVLPHIMQPIVIEFLELPLRKVEKKTFVIRNETAADSSFSITVKNFSSTDILEEKHSRNTNISITYASVMGLKPVAKNWGDMKKPGEGLVLVTEPMNGSLRPYEAVPIDVYAYSDTWGIYTDEVTINIDGLPPYIFGICIQVTELPISFPICRNGQEKSPLVRFGAMRFGSKPETRSVVMENTSNVHLFINWYCFLTGPKNMDDSVPINIILEMYSPFTGEDNTDNDSVKEDSVQKLLDTQIPRKASHPSILQLNEFNPVSVSTTESSFDSTATEYRTDSTLLSTSTGTWSGCYSADSELRERAMLERKVNNITAEGLDNDFHEYFGDHEPSSCSKKSTTSKETTIELTMTPYYGEQDYSVFVVTPQELFIRAGGKKTITITINPDKVSMIDYENEICARVMGFIRVSPMNKYKEECFSRQDGHFLAPVDIQLQVKIVRPFLSFDICKSQRTFKFYAATVMAQYKKQERITKQFVFRNLGTETIHVNFESSDPFHVISAKTLRMKITPEKCDGLFVQAKECVEVELSCTVGPNWIENLMNMYKNQDMQNLTVNMNRSLLITHVGSWTQVIQLYLKIVLPSLRLSTSDLNFGCVYIGNTKKLTLTIENMSAGKQWFRIRKKLGSNVFSVHPKQGSLLSRPAGGNYTLSVTVSYIPTEPQKSMEILEILTNVPGYCKECVLQGYATLDEKYNLPGK